jgi:hypothetical protein
MLRRSPSLVLVQVVWATFATAAGCAPDHVHLVVRLASSVSLGELCAV